MAFGPAPFLAGVAFGGAGLAGVGTALALGLAPALAPALATAAGLPPPATRLLSHSMQLVKAVAQPGGHRRRLLSGADGAGGAPVPLAPLASALAPLVVAAGATLAAADTALEDSLALGMALANVAHRHQPPTSNRQWIICNARSAAHMSSVAAHPVASSSGSGAAIATVPVRVPFPAGPAPCSEAPGSWPVS